MDAYMVIEAEIHDRERFALYAEAVAPLVAEYGGEYLVLGGLHGGWFTATEAGAVAVLYAALLEGAFHRRLGLGELRACALETATLLGALFPVLI
ncbi:MAG: DUF1330 domain-containing protein, partial [Geminicoccaceae bacterium]|nr:DUF1330 domain-containing protein [Geminicoccaceae bacterium]